MIKIEFELKDKGEVIIFGIDEACKRKEIGHIFTPAGSGGGNLNAIQICGFDHAYDFWGCGVYGDKATGKMKKDIQLLWFDNYEMMNNEGRRKVKVGEERHEGKGINAVFTTPVMKDRFSMRDDGVCMKCFNHPCTCEVNIIYENPYTVKREQDVRPTSLEDYKREVKNKVIHALGDKNGR